MNKIMNFFHKGEVGEPPWDYYFLQNLPEGEYPRYLAKLFYLNTGEKLPLRHGVIDKRKCKTFNQKIQWLKLYGVRPLMRDCTDKIKVRDYVKEKIGEEYLKPVLQVIPKESHETMRCHCEQVNDNLGLARQSTLKSEHTMDCHADNKMPPSARNDRLLKDVTTYFEQINWDKLPNAFVIKTNHGCKWQYIIKDKNLFLQNKRLFDEVKQNITGWLEQDYSFWNGFEMQYRNIEPKLIIEEFLGNEKEIPQETEVYCFNGIPKIIKKVHNDIPDKLTMYDENFNCIDLKFLEKEFLVDTPIDELTKQTIDLSMKLCIKNPSPQLSPARGEGELFKFVRIDWLIYQNKIYFNEMTFTPNSGLIPFDRNWNKKLGSYLEI